MILDTLNYNKKNKSRAGWTSWTSVQFYFLTKTEKILLKFLFIKNKYSDDKAIKPVNTKVLIKVFLKNGRARI